MTRGRKPNPKNLHLVGEGAGAPGTDSLAVPELAIPDCPDHLAGEARAEWDRVTQELFALGYIARINRATVAAYCTVYGRWVECERLIQTEGAAAKAAELPEIFHSGLVQKSPNGYAMPSIHLSNANKCLEQLRAWAGEFGMTPASLARAAKAAQGDLFDDAFGVFLGNGKASA